MKYLFQYFLFCSITFICNAQNISSKDDWTSLNSSSAKKIVYVSSSEGNENGQVYPFPNNFIGDDPKKPKQKIVAFKSIEKALKQIKEGESVWVLLKNGDRFYESLIPRSGLSEESPFIYSSYGNSSSPPLLLTGKNEGIISYNRDIKNFWIIGISFYAHTRNPQDSNYINSDGKPGFEFYIREGFEIKNILLEGNVFRYYTNNMVHGYGSIKNVKIRRNIIVDNYSEKQHSQGIFAQNVEGLLLQDNIFDHNGWFKKAQTQGASKEGGQATMFNHNTYFANTKNVTFENNSFHRPSSIGTKWTANDGSSSTSEINITNNFFNDCEFAISIGGNNRNAPYRFKNISIKDNVITNMGDSQQTNRNLGWGIIMDDWDKGNCSNNIILSPDNSNFSGIGIGIKGDTRFVTINNNILHNFSNSKGLFFSDANLKEVTVSNNELSFNKNISKNYIEISNLQGSINFIENSYNIKTTNKENFKVQNKNISFNEWKNYSKENNAKSMVDDYPAPSRDFNLYIKEVLGLDKKSEFYQNIRKMSIHNWNDKYTATYINDWIKKGFVRENNNEEDNSVSLENIDQFDVEILHKPSSKNLVSEKSAVEGNNLNELYLKKIDKNDENNNTTFKFIKASNGYYRILNKTSGKYYRPYGCNGNNSSYNSVVETPTSYQGPCTLWKLIEIEKGVYRIENKATGEWLRPLECSSLNKSLIHLVSKSHEGQCTKFVIRKKNQQDLRLDTDTDLGLTIFPNPVKDWLNISVENKEIESIKTIKLVSLEGKIILDLNSQSKNFNKNSFDISSLASGTYLLILNIINGDKLVKTLVKE